MSHFSVLVIGADIEKQLQPYHEFECTGTADEFVKDVDRTEEARKKFAEATKPCLQSADGVLHDFFDERGAWRPEFSRPAPRYQGDTSRERFVPPGFKQVEVPIAQLRTFAQWVEGWYGWGCIPYGNEPDLEGQHKFGYILLNDAGEVSKCIDRTNPNAKWDWWTVGGRWTGFFKLKPGASGEVGEPGLLTPAAEDGRADQALKGAIDFAGMRDEAGAEAGAKWDKAHAIIGDATWESWDAVRERIKDVEEARAFYHSQPAVVALKRGDPRAFGWDLDDALSGPRDAYVQTGRDNAVATFAAVYRGEWSERGRMGWFACVSDEMPRGDWNRMFNDLLDGLPDDTLLTVVDCHI